VARDGVLEVGIVHRSRQKLHHRRTSRVLSSSRREEAQISGGLFAENLELSSRRLLRSYFAVHNDVNSFAFCGSRRCLPKSKSFAVTRRWKFDSADVVHVHATAFNVFARLAFGLGIDRREPKVRRAECLHHPALIFNFLRAAPRRRFVEVASEKNREPENKRQKGISLA